ncbi:MAG: YicC/YloC family endoribonuclease, partial [Athalassotoga sp.]
MTGYSKVNKNINDVFYTVEMKGVNHKYLNISFFLPYLFSSFEARSLPIVQSEIKRG